MNIGTAPAPVLPGGGPPRHSRALVLVIVLGLLAVAAGAVVVVKLTGQDDGVATTRDQPSAGAPTPTPAPDPQAATKAAVIDAYRKSWDALLAVGRDLAAKPDDPRLEEHSTDTALIAKQRSLTRAKANGQVLVGDVTLHPSVIEVTPAKATVVDCAIDRTKALQVSTGKEEALPGPDAVTVTATLVVEDGVWKVSTFRDEKRPCVPPAS